jgi:penicillin amidase
VRFKKDVAIEVESTQHGPILTPMIKGETRRIALKWNIYDPSYRLNFLYELNHASNWDEFEKAAADWFAPSSNLVYADDQGHIGYQAVGAVPYRPNGIVNLPIADSEHEWHGYIPLDRLPHAIDPVDGLIATANSRVTRENNISMDWAPPYRSERIYKALMGRNGLTRADMLGLQTDVYSEMDQELGHRFAYAIDHTKGANRRLQQAADILRSWDGRVTTISPATTIITNAVDVLWPMILEPKLGKDWTVYDWSAKSFALEEIVMHGNPRWLPKEYGNWDALLAAALEKGLQHGHAPGDLSKWSWGSVHKLTIEHPLYAMIPWLGGDAGVHEQPWPGDPTTVRVAKKGSGSSQRFVMDWSDPDGSMMSIPMGESGNPMSPWFKDEFSTWIGGGSLALPMKPGGVTHTLRLEPR